MEINRERIPTYNFLVQFLFMLFLSLYLHTIELCLGHEHPTVSCIKIEREALLAFQDNLNDSSGMLSSWVGEECCSWMGVGCDNQTGHVITLDLRGTDNIYRLARPEERRKLGGELSESVGVLENLQYLDLSHNSFRGSIPNSIGNLSSLKSLYLSRNWFNGTIPESFGQLSALINLDLSDNVLEGELPESLGILENLQSFDLSLNSFWGSIPASIGNLSSFESLYLSDNRLNGTIPKSFGQLSALINLDLYDNALEGELPESLGILDNLQSLHLSRNSFWGSIPASIGNMSFLESLDLSDSGLNGTIPESFGQLSALINLDLVDNALQGVITKQHLINLTHLERFSLSTKDPHCSLVFNVTNDWIPPFKLKSVDIENCRVGPAFGLWLQSQTELTNVTLYNVGIADIIPEEWLSRIASQVTNLNLSRNQIMGNLSTQLVLKFDNLDQIDLSSNSLQGPIPLWFTPVLHYLNFQNNSFSGSIPENISKYMPQLWELDLSRNRLYGEIPSSMCRLEGLNRLSLGSNRLTGKFPYCGERQQELQDLELYENHLQGEIPSWICKRMISLRRLYLWTNGFTGQLPNCWDKLRDLEALDVSNNSLSGRIPTSLGNLTKLHLLRLEKNNLHGEIPPSLRNCQQLNTIDLGMNKLSGDLQMWMGEGLPKLFILRLRSNLFHGNIPPQLCKLRTLHLLDLSHNNFSGCIPKCLNNLTLLVNVNYNSVIDPPWSRNSTGNSIRNGSAYNPLNPYEPAFHAHNGDPYEVGYSSYDGAYSSYDGAYRSYNGSRVRGIIDLFNDGYPMAVTKGREIEYTTTLNFVNAIDLSMNNLIGGIPDEMFDLSSLGILNLSMNHLSGSISQNIGNLRWLEVLDLSQNNLSGQIPQNLSSLTSLNHLNLSYNNFTGRIPSGNQLQTLNDSSIYEGNPLLCGSPLSSKCPGDNTSQPTSVEDGEKEDKHGYDFDKLCFYVSIIMGYLVGFWCVCGSLILKKSWRIAYFRFVENMKERILLQFQLKAACFKRKFGWTKD